MTENKFPAVCRAYTGEVPARLLLPEVDVNSFDPERRSAKIRAKLLPENCTYDDISWSVVRRNGVESNLAQVEGSGRSAVVTAKGDGEFFVRAMVHNGAEHPQVIADIPFTAEGLGAAVPGRLQLHLGEHARQLQRADQHHRGRRALQF